MSPAMIFVVPAVTAVMLALASGVAYRQTGRHYLLWWTGVWLVNLAYYVAVMLSVLFGQSQTDLFSQLGLLIDAAGVAAWGRPLGRRVEFWRPAGRSEILPARRRYRSLTLRWWSSACRWASRPPGPSPDRPTPSGSSWGHRTVAAASSDRCRHVLRAGAAFAGDAGRHCQPTDARSGRLDDERLDLHRRSPWPSASASLGGCWRRSVEVARARSHELAAANARLAGLDQLEIRLRVDGQPRATDTAGADQGVHGTLLKPGWTWTMVPRREFVQYIDDEADQLTELVANLLDMSRIEAGTLRVDPRPADLAGLLAACSTRRWTFLTPVVLAAISPTSYPSADTM